MKKAISLVILVLLLCGLSAPVMRAQERRRASSPVPLVMPLGTEGFVAFTLEAQGGEAGLTGASSREEVAGVVPQVLVDDNHIIHRVLVDARGRFVFGYDLRIEPQADARKFKIVVKPIDADFERRLQTRSPGQEPTVPARLATLPGTSDEQTVEDGAGLAVELLVNAETNTRIVDVVKVAFERARLVKDSGALLAASPAHATPEINAPRDFTLADVRLALRAPQLLLDGEPIAEKARPRDLRGQFIWFHLPQHGRFIFSLAPHEGYDFRKIGIVERNKISFEWQGARYEWESKEPIIESDARLYLWVLHDPRFDPAAFAPSHQSAEGDGKDSLTEKIEGFERRLRTLRNPGARRSAAEMEEAAKVAAPPPVRVTTGATDQVEKILPRP